MSVKPTLWRLRPGRTLRCPFERDNADPPPACECACECCCDCAASAYEAVIHCHRDITHRVIFVDGSFTDCCEPTGHGTQMVFWAAPLVCHPRFEGDFHRMARYFYRPEDLVALEERDNPIFRLMQGKSGRLKYEVSGT